MRKSTIVIFIAFALLVALAPFVPAQSPSGAYSSPQLGASPSGANTQVQYNNNGIFGASSQMAFVGGSCPLQLQNGGATNVFAGTPSGGLCNWTVGGGAGAVFTSSGSFQGNAYTTSTNCSSSASPAVCGSAAAGSVAVAAAATTVTVNTTAITANSQILLARDDSLGTKLSVTCNTATVMGEMKISSRTGGTSFTITVQTAPITNPGCISYSIIN